jgi:hypothetical protein
MFMFKCTSIFEVHVGMQMSPLRVRMYVCMYVSVYVCVCVCMYVCICMYVCMQHVYCAMCACTYIFRMQPKLVCMHVYMHVCTHAYVRVRVAAEWLQERSLSRKICICLFSCITYTPTYIYSHEHVYMFNRRWRRRGSCLGTRPVCINRPSVCMYVCMYICIYTHTYIHTYIHT